MQQNKSTESLIVKIDKGHILQEGSYMFIEFYCTDPECDCNNGGFQMIKLDSQGNETQNTIALVDYTWNEPISTKNPTLGPQFVGSKLAEAGLDEFTKLLLSDSNTITKIKEAYARTREDFREEDYYEEEYQQIKTIKNTHKTGRNELCPCGSGKKYKKCCLKT